MNDARMRVLRDIRRALRRNAPLPESVGEGLQARIRAGVANPQPRYDGDVADRFVDKLRAASGIVTRVDDPAGIAQAVRAHVEKWRLPFELVVAPDPALDDIPWSNRFTIARRAAVGADRVSVTGAFAGIGETGTVVLLSSPLSPTTLNFLPEDHLIVLRESCLLRYQEDAWAALRQRTDAFPRTVNLITGPSKTGDVEQTIFEGAHGPRRMHVILVNGA